MKHFILTYDVVPDMMERRGAVRPEHLALAQTFVDEGHLLLAGAFMDDDGGSMLLFQGETDEKARAFAEADPYVTSGLVTKWRVREWTTVMGKAAAAPIALS